MRLIFDAASCIGCKACVQACRDAGNLPAGKGVMNIEVKENARTCRIEIAHRLHTCKQCTKPACLAACPSGAITHDDTGVVRIDSNICTACGCCAKACSFNAIARLSSGVRKCELCPEHKRPACVAACPMMCLSVG